MRDGRTIAAKLVLDAEHYEEVVKKAALGAQVSVWIGTANLKTMLIEAPIGTRDRAAGRYVSFFQALAERTRQGVDVRVLHAAVPSRPLQKELGAGRVAVSGRGVQLRQCPRVHLKMIAVDGRLLYLGSANLTGAGLGAKGEGRRNFEMGILTDSDALLDAAQERFDRIWRGAECAGCKLRRECPAPIDQRRAPKRRLPVGPPADGRVTKETEEPRPKATAASKAAPKPAPAVTSPGGSSRRARRSPSAPR